MILSLQHLMFYNLIPVIHRNIQGLEAKLPEISQ